jgi:hypothetical protein
VRVHPAILILVLAAFAIDRGSQPKIPASESVVDPAGVTVVVNRAPLWETGDQWTVDPAPLVQVGSVGGDRAYLFQDIEGATRLADGRLLVLEAGQLQFRVFDEAGRHLVSFGRPGEGPGEFGTVPEWTVIPGDTVLAYDASRSRYSWFTMDGQLARDAQTDRFLAAGERRAMASRERRLFPDGSILRADLGVRSREDLRSLSSAPGLAGITVERASTELRLSLVDGLGEGAVSLGNFMNAETIALRASGAGAGASISNPYFPQVHYGIDPAEGQVHVALPGVKEIHSYDQHGALERIVRQEVPLYPLTEEMMDASLEALLVQPGAKEFSPFTMATAFGLLSVPDSVFPYSGLEVDTEGNLWLLDRYRLTSGGPEPYQLFDADGMWLGPLVLPQGIGHVLERGDDYLLTEWLGELDVPYLRMYRLRKGQQE